MRYCVIKDTLTVIDGSLNTDKAMLQNAINAGFTVDEVEILMQEQYDTRKAIVPIDALKDTKIKELNEACNRAVLGRFKAIINEAEYEFSYDYEAQSRFNGIGLLFFANKISEIEWTAYENGQRVRIMLNNDNFDIVTLAALHHQNYNVTKFNQLLLQVNSATTKEQIEEIIW